MGCALNIKSYYENQRDWSFFEVKHRTEYGYDAFNRILSVTDPKNLTTQYTYTATGRILSISNQKGIVYQFSYNNLGRLTSKTNADGKTYQYFYDAVGNKTKEIDPSGLSKSYEYDALNRLTKAILPDDTVTLKYDKLGNLSEARNNISLISNETNTMGRLKRTVMSGLGSFANYPTVDSNYSYDNNGNLIQRQSALGTIQYSYDDDNALLNINDASSGENIAYAYDSLSRLSEITRPGSGNRSTYTYDTSSNLAEISHFSQSTKSDFITLGYDQQNMINTRTDFFGQKNYTFDSNGQLTQNADTAVNVDSESFTYDSIGNRLTDNQNTNPALIYNQSGQQLTEDQQYNYNYNANGNLISKIAKLVFPRKN